MTKPTGSIRPLVFPLKESEDIQSNTPATPATSQQVAGVFPSDPDERAIVTLELSLNEYVALATCIDVGRDIAYGDNSIYLWWVWTRALTDMICEQIADCIENNEDVQNALNNYFSGAGNGGTGTGGGAGAGSQTNITITNNPYNMLAGGACTSDNMYAVAVQITDLSFETVNQLYQVIDQAISPLELATEIADNAPAVATAVPATAGDWLIWVQETAHDSWQVFDSPSRRTEVACDIFCLMEENGCTLTFDDLFNYFADKTLTAIFGVTLESVLLDMVDILLTDEVGWTSLAFMFSMLSLGSKVAGVTNVGGFLTTIAAYIDETNNNWTVECDPCGALPCWQIWTDVTSGNGGIDNENGTFTSQDSDDGDPTTQQRVNIETVGALAAVAFTGTGTPANPPSLVRLWSGQAPYSGSLVFSGSWSSFVANSPVSAGSFVSAGNLQYTIEMTVGTDKC